MYEKKMSLLPACMADFSGLLFIRSKQFFFSCVSETASVNHASHACCKNGGTSYVVKDVLLFDRLCVERCVGVQKIRRCLTLQQMRLVWF